MSGKRSRSPVARAWQGVLGASAHAAVVLVLVLVTACGQSPSQADQDGGDLEHDQIKIGFSMDSFVVERWQRDRDAFLDEARILGVEVILRTANERLDVQREQLLELSQSDIDVLVVVPNDAERLSDVIESIRNRGVPVLAYDRLVRNTPIDGYISFDNQGIGSMMAEAVLSELDSRGDEDRTVLVINGALSDYNSFMINRGIVTALIPRVDSGRVTVLDSLWLQTWRNEEAREAIEGAFDRFEHISGVIAANDLIADAVVRSAAARGLAGKLLVSGMDGDIAAVQRVAEGTQLMTIYKPVEDLARQAVHAALELAETQTLEADEHIHNGRVDVPFIRLAPVMVTQERILDTVIADRFHSYEDVFRNVPESRRPTR